MESLKTAQNEKISTCAVSARIFAYALSL